MTTLSNPAFRHLQMCLKIRGKQRPSSREERTGSRGPSLVACQPPPAWPAGSACRHSCVGSKVDVAFWDRRVPFSARNASSLRHNKAPAMTSGVLGCTAAVGPFIQELNTLVLAGLTGKHVRAASLATFHAEDTPASPVGGGGGPCHQSPCPASLKMLNIAHPLGVGGGEWGSSLQPAGWKSSLCFFSLQLHLPGSKEDEEGGTWRELCGLK